ncbi:MAG: hypothetical protein JNL10_22045 [Verrucomicrobiales bacterium]|nr:hypothetical protein [Verrucomicrobiales bacterium]
MPRHRREFPRASALRLLRILIATFAICPPGYSDLPQVRLLGLFPPGAAAGSTNEISVSGTDLEDPKGLSFSDPRIRALPVASNAAIFQVIVPAEVPPGPVQVRWNGRFGTSNPRTFVIGTGPETVLNPTNTTAASAVRVDGSAVVSGRIPAGQTLWFRFRPHAGQRWIAEVPVRALETRLEPVLRVFDASGQELASSRRGWIEVPSTKGEVWIQVCDVTYRGGDEFPFRFRVSASPRIDFVIPSVLTPGITNRLTLFGRNLDASQPSALMGTDGSLLDQVTVDLVGTGPAVSPDIVAGLLGRPASAFLARQVTAWQLSGSNGISNPVLLGVSTNPVVVGPIDSGAPPALPIPVRPPVEFHGLFPRRGELSGVTFEARKGDVYWVELWAERMGAAADPAAVVQRQLPPQGDSSATRFSDVLELGDNESNPGGSEFNLFTRDPVGRFEAPEDGTYRILVRDLFHTSGKGPRLPYRLSIRRESPSFALVALPMQPTRANDNDRAIHPLAPFVRKGGVELIRVLVQRRDGFNGEIELSASGWTNGVTSDSTRIPSGQSVGFLPVIAGSEASGLQRPLIVGRPVAPATAPEAVAVMVATGPAADFNESVIPFRVAVEPQVDVSASEMAPVSVDVPNARAVEAHGDGKVSIPIGVVRRGDFNGAFSLKLAGRPEFDKAKEATVPEKATNATLEINLSEAKPPEGLYRVWLQGQIAGKYRNNPEALTAAESDLKAAETALAAATAADKPLLEERRKAAEERRKAAEERSKPRDVTVRVYSRPFDLRILPPPKPEAKTEAKP